MVWKSRKRVANDDGPDDYVEDGFVVGDGAEDSHRTKKHKAPSSPEHSRSTQPKPGFPTDSNTVPGGGVEVDGQISWELSNARKVTVSQYQGKTFVGIREFYEKDGKSLPGKKGISLSLQQYYALLEIIPHVESVLAKKGETVPRPQYGPAQTATHENVKEQGEDIEATDRMDEEKESSKKPNHEATSDEEE